MTLLVFLNTAIYNEMKKHKHDLIGVHNDEMMWKTQLQIANINIVIVIMFILCHLFRQIPQIHDLYARLVRKYVENYFKDMPNEDLMYTLTEVSQVIVVLNSSVNFYVYMFKRRLLKNAHI